MNKNNLFNKEVIPDKIQKVEREIIPNIFQGCQFPNESIVIVRQNNLRLVWRKGGKSWLHRMDGSCYAPTELSVFCTEPEFINDVLHTGGRLSNNILKEHKKEIENYFGEGILDFVDIKKTLVIQN